MSLNLEPVDDPAELQEGKIRNRAGRIIARVVGAFDWDEDLHLRHAKGTEDGLGGQFMKKGKGRGRAATPARASKLSNRQVGKALGTKSPGGVVDDPDGDPNDRTSLAFQNKQDEALDRSAMLSPGPSGKYATNNATLAVLTRALSNAAQDGPDPETAREMLDLTRRWGGLRVTDVSSQQRRVIVDALRVDVERYGGSYDSMAYWGTGMASPDMEESPSLTMLSPPGGWTATDAKDHPQYPKDAKWADKQGEFVRVGDRWSLEGSEWEVTQISLGAVFLEEASGKKSKVELRILKPGQNLESTMKKAKRASMSTKVLGNEGVEGKGSEKSTVRAVVPYVDPTTHDPELKLPATSTLTEEQWLAFGEAEQMHYIDLMGRYGAWGSNVNIMAMVKSILKEFDSDIVNMVKEGHQSQYGSSTGGTLSLADGLSYQSKNFTGSPAALLKREKAMDLQGRIRDVIAWDNYNRVKAPDIALFHGTRKAPPWWKSLISKRMIFSGLSQSWNVTSGKFGSNKVATPTSIRHIVLATNVVNWVGTGYGYELEMAIIPQQVVDTERTLFFKWSDLSYSAQKWLETSTKSTVRPGSFLTTLQGHMKEGWDLPFTQEPEINFPNNKELPPPPEAATALEDMSEGLKSGLSSGSPVLSKEELKGLKLPWGKVDAEGNPVAQIASESGVKAGDFMLGLKGTLYWIGPSSGSFGLQYHKLEPDGNGKLQFTDEGPYEFEGGGGNPYYFLKGNVPPTKPADAPVYDNDAWQLAAESPKKIADHQVGGMFKVDGVPYQKMSAAAGGKVAIMDMTNGKQGTINSEYKTVQQIPVSGYIPAGSLQPAKGMTFALDGLKHTITSVKKNGMVSAKPVTAGSKVKQLEGDDPALSNLFNPADWEIGPKAKLATLQVGDIFHGGNGKIIRPYRVTEIEGAKVHWENLDTGHKGVSSRQKAVWALDAAGGTASDAAKPTPLVPKPAPEPTPDEASEVMNPPVEVMGEPGDIVSLESGKLGKVGDKPIPLKDLPINGFFAWSLTMDGEKKPTKVVLKLLPNGQGLPVTVSAGPVDISDEIDEVFLVKEVPTKAPEIGEEVLLTTLEPGDKFQIIGFEPEYELIDVDSSGLIIVKNLETDEVSTTPSLNVSKTGTTSPEPQWSKHGVTFEGKQTALSEMSVGAQFTQSNSIGPAGSVVFEKNSEQTAKVVMLDGASTNSNEPGAAVTQMPLSLLSASTGNLVVEEAPPEDIDSDAGFDEPTVVDVPADDLDALPTAELDPYKSKFGSGAKYTHDQIQEMPVGMVFKDKTGKRWKVQVNAADAVITDGVTNFKIDGTLRGRALPDQTMAGPPPPVQAPSPWSLESAAAKVQGSASLADGPPDLLLTAMGDNDLSLGDLKAKAMAINAPIYIHATPINLGHSPIVWQIDPDGKLWTVQADSTLKPNGINPPSTWVPKKVLIAGTSESATPEPKKAIEVSDFGAEQLSNLDEGEEWIGSNDKVYSLVGEGKKNTYIKDKESGEVIILPGAGYTTATAVDEALKQDAPTPSIEASNSNTLGATNATLEWLLAVAPDNEDQLPDPPFDFYGSPWGSGAKYKHDYLSDLKPGTHFTAKGQKSDYILVKSLAGGKVLVFRPDDGSWYRADETGRVRAKGQD